MKNTPSQATTILQLLPLQMKKLPPLFFLLICLFYASPDGLYAQPYKSALGVRFGRAPSVSSKTYLNETRALEIHGGFFGYTPNADVFLRAAYLWHENFAGSKNLRGYFGGGLGLQVITYDIGIVPTVSGYVGLEYASRKSPVSVAIDFSPNLLVTGGVGYDTDGALDFIGLFSNLAVRYTMGRKRLSRDNNIE